MIDSEQISRQAKRAIDDAALAFSQLPNTVEFFDALCSRDEMRLKASWEAMGQDEQAAARRAVVIAIVFSGNNRHCWYERAQLLVRSL